MQDCNSDALVAINRFIWKRAFVWTPVLESDKNNAIFTS